MKKILKGTIAYVKEIKCLLEIIVDSISILKAEAKSLELLEKA